MAEIIGLFIENKQEPNATSSTVGDHGENLAAAYLRRRGFQLVMSNFRAPIGRNRKGVQVTGEIDLIVLDGETICFVEVKTRTSADFASPLSAVDIRKQRQITRTSRVYRKTFNINGRDCRFDVVSIILHGRKAPEIELIKGFWDEAKFNKRTWSGDI